MLTTRLYPIDLLQCGKSDWQVMGGSVEGLRSFASDTPDRMMVGRGGLWHCTMSDVWLETREEKAAWRGLRAQMRNGGLGIVVPLERVEWFARPLFPNVAALPYSDGAFHSDGTGFRSGAIGARLLSAAELGDIEISVRVLGAEGFIASEPFTIVHERADIRLYEVAGVLQSDPVVTGGEIVGYDYRLEINPPLRDDVAADQDVDFNDPRCVMRLSDPDGMPFDEEIVTFSSVSFVEDLRALADPPA